MYLLRDINTNKAYIWGSDLHFNEDRFESFALFLEEFTAQHQKNEYLSGLLITGDIADQGNPILWISRLRALCDLPCYFVLGNHDYYGSSLLKVRSKLLEQQQKMFENQIYYTPFERNGLFLSDEVVLIGVDGWVDGRVGNYLQSSVRIRDWDEIEDFMYMTSDERLEVIQSVSDQEVYALSSQLHSLPKSVKKIIILTHVPPYRESCLWQNKVANDQWAPHFICGHMGIMLKTFFSQHKEIQGLVLCGHSHHRATYQPLGNLCVETAAPYDESHLLDICGITQIQF